MYATVRRKLYDAREEAIGLRRERLPLRLERKDGLVHVLPHPLLDGIPLPRERVRLLFESRVEENEQKYSGASI
jgi:hypothetical protein